MQAFSGLARDELTLIRRTYTEYGADFQGSCGGQVRQWGTDARPPLTSTRTRQTMIIIRPRQCHFTRCKLQVASRPRSAWSCPLKSVTLASEFFAIVGTTVLASYCTRGQKNRCALFLVQPLPFRVLN